MEKELMKEAMHDACIRAVTEISADVKALVQAALDRETNETAKSMLSSMLENLDIASKLSREAISTRNWSDTNPDPLLARLEDELRDNINKLGLGAAGTGGDTVCLAVKIGTAATHTAIAPVAINFHCWVARRAGIRMYNDGRIEKLL